MQRGFEIPSFNFVTEKENVKGRAGSIVKNRYLNDIEFDLPLIIRKRKIVHQVEKKHTMIY
ncbi:phage tail family protein [Staphylococcus aureus]|nr:phage tail family protein [Staphylococcus aureus]